jgi:hypothetical protein
MIALVCALLAMVLLIVMMVVGLFGFFYVAGIYLFTASAGFVIVAMLALLVERMR